MNSFLYSPDTVHSVSDEFFITIFCTCVGSKNLVSGFML